MPVAVNENFRVWIQVHRIERIILIPVRYNTDIDGCFVFGEELNYSLRFRIAGQIAVVQPHNKAQILPGCEQTC